MTTSIPFQPSLTNVPQFQVTLDGDEYSVQVQWNLEGQRYYVGIFTLGSTLVATVPLVVTSPALTLQNAQYDVLTGLVTAKVITPHEYSAGLMADLFIDGCTPDGYNGRYLATVVDPFTATYPVDADPGQISTLGTLSYPISMTEGYFSSMLIYRNGAFEVWP